MSPEQSGAYESDDCEGKHATVTQGDEGSWPFYGRGDLVFNAVCIWLFAGWAAYSLMRLALS